MDNTPRQDRHHPDCETNHKGPHCGRYVEFAGRVGVVPVGKPNRAPAR